MPIKDSELILNPDGSVYHLNLRPEHLANTIITVGDPDRVANVTKHFDTIEFETRKREFHTQTGTYKGKRITVISTGIGTDNIDIVFNELDALVNIDLETREIKKGSRSATSHRVVFRALALCEGARSGVLGQGGRRQGRRKVAKARRTGKPHTRALGGVARRLQARRDAHARTCDALRG